MRQVPTYQYLIIGRGRLARHLQQYLRSLELDIEVWHRGSSLQLKDLLSPNQVVLLAISDDAIEDFVRENDLDSRTCVHFSGKLSTPLALGAHPLYTFSEDVYHLDVYPTIPFVIERPHLGRFRNLFPALNNPLHEIDPRDKPLYHALCVMGGNFSTILWEKLFAGFSEMGLPKDLAAPYMKRVFTNLADSSTKANSTSVLTGPLVRGDLATMTAHRQVLTGSGFERVYDAFAALYGYRFNTQGKNYEHT